MKILIVSDWFLRLVVPNQARALAELGHDVRVLTRDHALEFNGDHDERREVIDASGVEFLELSGSRYGPDSLGGVLRIGREIRAWGPDVVSAHQNTDPRLLAISKCAPIAYTVHDPEPHPESHRPKRRETVSDRMWERAASAIVIHSDLLRGQVRGSLARTKPVVSVPHGVDMSPAPLPVPSEPTVMMFGRLEAYKGTTGLIEAMCILWQTRPHVRLIVAGKGPAAGDVPEDPRIELISRYVTEEETARLLARTSVSVLPYIQASQSGVGLMTLSHGIPTVVTTVGGLPDLAFPGLPPVPPGDPTELASRIAKALDMGQTDRELIHAFTSELFSWNTVARRYVDVYRTLVGRP